MSFILIMPGNVTGFGFGTITVNFYLPSSAPANSYTSGTVTVSGVTTFFVGPGHIERCTGSPCSSTSSPGTGGWSTIKSFTLDQTSMTVSSIPTGSTGTNVKFRAVVAPLGRWVSGTDTMTITAPPPPQTTITLNSVADVYYGEKTRFDYQISTVSPSSANLLVREQGTSTWDQYPLSTSLGTGYKNLELVPDNYEAKIQYVTNGNTKNSYTRTFEVGQRVLFLVHGFTASSNVWNTFEANMQFINDVWAAEHSSRSYMYDHVVAVDYYNSHCTWDDQQSDWENLQDCLELWVPIGPGTYSTGNFQGNEIVKTVSSTSDNLAKRFFDNYISSGGYVDSLNTKIDIVAHSMGGLVSRAMIQNYIETLSSWDASDLTFDLNGGTHQLNNIVFLGTPNQGLDIDNTVLSVFLPDQMSMMDNTQTNPWVTDSNDLNSNPPSAMDVYTIAGTSREDYFTHTNDFIRFIVNTFSADFRESNIMDGLIVRENVQLSAEEAHWEFNINHDELHEDLRVFEFVGGLLAEDQVVEIEFTFELEEIDLINFDPLYPYLGGFEFYVNNRLIHSLDYTDSISSCIGAPTGPGHDPGIFAVQGLKCNVWKTVDINLDFVPYTRTPVVIEVKAINGLSNQPLIGYTMFLEFFDLFYNINHFGEEGVYNPIYPGDEGDALKIDYYLF